MHQWEWGGEERNGESGSKTQTTCLWQKKWKLHFKVLHFHCPLTCAYDTTYRSDKWFMNIALLSTWSSRLLNVERLRMVWYECIRPQYWQLNLIAKSVIHNQRLIYGGDLLMSLCILLTSNSMRRNFQIVFDDRKHLKRWFFVTVTNSHDTSLGLFVHNQVFVDIDFVHSIDCSDAFV